MDVLMQLPIWFDKDFFKNGLYFPINQREVIFAKEGVWSFERPENSPYFEFSDFAKVNRQFYTGFDEVILDKAVVEKWPYQQVAINTDFTHHLSDFEDDFQFAKKQLQNQLKKIVLMMRTQAKLPKIKTEHLLSPMIVNSIKRGKGEPFGILKEDLSILGSTPELLFEIKDTILKTYALAGTVPLSNSEDIFSPKIMKEHQIVIDQMIESLRPFSLRVEMQETVLHPYGRMVHLKTPIQAQLDTNINISELTDILSPTAAIGGYPKDLTAKVLQRTTYGKSVPMRYHGGTFTYHANNFVKSIVMIRHIEVSNSEINIDVGAGVVEESCFEDEKSEVLNKFQSIRETFL
jgi:isochorismate synthase EntC